MSENKIEFNEPREAFAVATLDYVVESCDDGIGYYDCGGATGFDSEEYVKVTSEGCVELTWVQEDDTQPEGFLCDRNHLDSGVTVEFDVWPTGGAVMTQVSEFVWYVTQTFEYTGEGTRTVMTCGNDGHDRDDDDGPDFSDADYDEAADRYFDRG